MDSIKLEMHISNAVGGSPVLNRQVKLLDNKKHILHGRANNNKEVDSALLHAQLSCVYIDEETMSDSSSLTFSVKESDYSNIPEDFMVMMSSLFETASTLSSVAKQHNNSDKICCFLEEATTATVTTRRRSRFEYQSLSDGGEKNVYVHLIWHDCLPEEYFC